MLRHLASSLARHTRASSLTTHALAAVTTRGQKTGAGAGAGAGAGKGNDFVLDTLKEEMQQLNVYLEECKKIYYPLGQSDDEKLVRTFSEQFSAAKKKAGVPSSTARMRSLLGFYKWLAGDSVREYMNQVTPNMSPENATAYMKALDDVELEIGKPLLTTDKKNFEVFKGKIKAAFKAYENEVKEKTGKSAEEILKDYAFYEAKAHLKEVEEDAKESMVKAAQDKIVDVSGLDAEVKEEMKKLGCTENDFKDSEISLKQVADLL
eukprot:CAMPEP_0197471006 /NCGR_PEP_ID=MMETSP1309-20131121/1833_1 /TAXON_ID=464262 /ORGANISM="Genus nov. species nov., Strain RCC998" /LENGTH=263 /DNA_ID=CAMNT_0043008347 /DNA_START=51 /DNA_END=839 /DNA_ORIENTATION=+